MTAKMEDKTKVPKLVIPSDVPPHEKRYTTGAVGKLLGIASRSAAKMMDRHPDLAFRVGEDRRIRHLCLIEMVAREGISHHQLGWSLPLTWVGREIEGQRESTDLQSTEVMAGIMAARGEVGSIACLRHRMPSDEMLFLAKIAEERHVRLAAVVPEDRTDLCRKTKHVWFYAADTGVNEADVMRWLRLAGREGGK